MIPPFQSPPDGPGSIVGSIFWIVALLLVLTLVAAILWFLFGLGWIWIILLAAFLKRVPRNHR